MTWVSIMGAMAALFVVCWVLGSFKEKHPRAWRQVLSAVVLFGGIWLSAYGDYQTISLMAFLLPIVSVFAMAMFWERLDANEAKQKG